MAYVIADKRNIKPPFVLKKNDITIWKPIFFEDKGKAEKVCASFNMINMHKEEKYVVVDESAIS